ncbi:hypothetical protein KAZ82_02135, partial [Candidatus Babeliales bacterium]|nr:hypothetical protein [Candidatus Babeliales bacterium]
RKSECGPGPKMMTPEEYEKHIARGAQIAREATINFERAEEEATENNSRQLLMQEENRAFNELNIKFCLYKRLCRDVVLKTLSYHS